MLRIYDGRGDKPFSVIKVMDVDSSACVRVKEGEIEQFRIDSGMTRVYHVSLAVQCIYGWSEKKMKMEIGRRGVRFLEDGREWRLPGLL